MVKKTTLKPLIMAVVFTLLILIFFCGSLIPIKAAGRPSLGVHSREEYDYEISQNLSWGNENWICVVVQPPGTYLFRSSRGDSYEFTISNGVSDYRVIAYDSSYSNTLYYKIPQNTAQYSYLFKNKTFGITVYDADTVTVIGREEGTVYTSPDGAWKYINLNDIKAPSGHYNWTLGNSGAFDYTIVVNTYAQTTNHYKKSAQTGKYLTTAFDTKKESVEYGKEYTVKYTTVPKGYKKAGLGGTFSVNGSTQTSYKYTVTGPATNSAYYDPIKYTITYLPNTATSGSMTYSTHYYDYKTALTANDYKKQFKVSFNAGEGESESDYLIADYAFGGWNTKADGSGTAFANSQQV